MGLESILVREISKECDKLIKRYHNYHNHMHLEYLRDSKRLNKVKDKYLKEPDYWTTNKGCNPFYVKKNINVIAHSIAKKITERKYQPLSPSTFEILKENGSLRPIVVYPIADNVVSKLFYKRLLKKNKHRFSSYAYAYRNDRNVHFAIEDISIDLSKSSRSFVAEFDFSDFFGNISHDYLRKQFDLNGFKISDEERYIIDVFLSNQGSKGIPQGTSISLFLANLACWELDHKLEKEGLNFARYADDTLIWSTNYQKICNSFNMINEFSQAAGIPINTGKSEGISLLKQPDYKKSEFSEKGTKTNVDFLGYSIAIDKISFRQKSIENIKKEISYIIYKNLIQPLRNNNFRTYIGISKNKDYHLMVAIMQIKRYIYGGLNNGQLVNYITGRSNRLMFKGLMSFYPLVNDESQLNSLDGWLIATLHRAIKLREKLLINGNYILPGKYAFPLDKTNLIITLNTISKSKYHRNYEIPSFMLIHKALKVGIKKKGISNIIRLDIPEYNY